VTEVEGGKGQTLSSIDLEDQAASAPAGNWGTSSDSENANREAGKPSTVNRGQLGEIWEGVGESDDDVVAEGDNQADNPNAVSEKGNCPQ